MSRAASNRRLSGAWPASWSGMSISILLGKLALAVLAAVVMLVALL
jgi:hypothetical protein